MTETSEEVSIPASARESDQIYKIVALVIKCVLIGYGVHELRVAIEALAGYSTSLKVAMNLEVNRNLVDAAAIVFGGGGIAYGLRERKLKRDKTQSMASRITQLELGYDPKRSSSGLLPDGRTNPSDK